MIERLRQRFAAVALRSKSTNLAASCRFLIWDKIISLQRISISIRDVVKDTVACRNLHFNSRAFVVVTKIAFDEVIVTASIEPKARADVVCEFVMTYAAMSKGRDELGAAAVPVESNTDRYCCR